MSFRAEWFSEKNFPRVISWAFTIIYSVSVLVAVLYCWILNYFTSYSALSDKNHLWQNDKIEETESGYKLANYFNICSSFVGLRDYL